MVPDVRGTDYFDFRIVLYLTVLWRARNRKEPIARPSAPPMDNEAFRPRANPLTREQRRMIMNNMSAWIAIPVNGPVFNMLAT
jgi:hypothetical protein